MAYDSLWKNCNQKRRTLDIKSKRTKSSLVQLQTVLAIHLSDFTYILSEQKLTILCNINHPKFPCKICAKNVQDKDEAIQCNICELWIHIKCNNLNYLDYRYLQNCDESWYCIACCSTIFPFNSLSSNKKFLACCTNTDSNITLWKDL